MVDCDPDTDADLGNESRIEMPFVYFVYFVVTVGLRR